MPRPRRQVMRAVLRPKRRARVRFYSRLNREDFAPDKKKMAVGLVRALEDEGWVCPNINFVLHPGPFIVCDGDECTGVSVAERTGWNGLDTYDIRLAVDRLEFDVLCHEIAHAVHGRLRWGYRKGDEGHDSVFWVLHGALYRACTGEVG